MSYYDDDKAEEIAAGGLPKNFAQPMPFTPAYEDAEAMRQLGESYDRSAAWKLRHADYWLIAAIVLTGVALLAYLALR